MTENRIRLPKLTTKKALFASYGEGAGVWVRIASLMETCKMNRVEPHAWIQSALKKIAKGHQQSSIHELPPWGFEPEKNDSHPYAAPR